MRFKNTSPLLILLLLVSRFTFAQTSEVTINQEIDTSIIEPAVITDTTRYPLKPPNLESPRATIFSFIDYMDRSYRILMQAHAINKRSGGLGISESVEGDVVQAELIFNRAFNCLDMSSFPPSIQKDIGYGRAMMLKEILDRIELPPIEEIPGRKEVEIDLESKKYPTLLRWNIPNTNIVLVKQTEGPHQWEYQFSSETIENLPIYYSKVKHLPYVKDRFITAGYYEFYKNTPGLLLPPNWSRYLPEFSTRVLMKQTLWQWFALIIGISLSILIVRLIFILTIEKTRNFSSVARKWLKVLFYFLTITINYQLYLTLSLDVNLTGKVLIYTKLFMESLSWTLISVMVFHLFIALAETIIVAPKVDKIGIEAAYTRAIMGVIALVAAGFFLVFGLSQIGVSVVPLLTGVGIGGIAIALAARSTIENIISSFTIFIDKPYRAGDRVKVLGHNGTIEFIGIRSTRIRLLSGPITSIPNEKMASAEIENIQQRPFIKRTLQINIPYATSADKTNRAVEIIRDILAVRDISDDDSEVQVGGEKKSFSNKAINQPDKPPRVFFKDIESDSLVIELTYWYHPPEWWEYMEHAHWVNVQILEQFNEEGIEIAMPTHKVHLAGNDDLSDFSDIEKT